MEGARIDAAWKSVSEMFSIWGLCRCNETWLNPIVCCLHPVQAFHMRIQRHREDRLAPGDAGAQGGEVDDGLSQPWHLKKPEVDWLSKIYG